MNKKAHFILILMIILALALGGASSALAQGNNSGTSVQVCPQGQGYWANHPEAWPVTNIMLGIQFYSQAELLAILPGGGGDASTMLAVQLASTKLNIAAGADATPISATMLQADALLAQFGGKLPYNVAPSAPEGQAMVSLAGLLDLYNNGQMSPNCIQTPTPTFTPTATSTPGPSPTPTATFTPGPSPTPTATSSGTTIVIEGPVQVINVNIITIYDINIQVNDRDPILARIHVGDFVRVEGNAVNNTTVLIVQAVNVFVVNVDVVITNNNVVVWQDDGKNCGNPPPPWAPANGWRRRCENRPTTIIITGGSGDGGMGMGMGMGDDD